MKNVLIVGATGMVGGIVLREALNATSIAKVTVLTRRSLEIQHEKLVEVIHKDFSDYSGVEEYFENQDICLLYTSPSPRDLSTSRMPSSA